MQYSGATVSEGAVRRHVKRFSEHKEFENGAESGVGDVVSSTNSLFTSPSQPPWRRWAVEGLVNNTTRRCSALPRFINNIPPCAPTSKYSSITKTKKQAIEKLSDWMSNAFFNQLSYDILWIMCWRKSSQQILTLASICPLLKIII